MKSYQELIKECLAENRAKVEMLQAYESVIWSVNQAVVDFKNEEGIDFINVYYPSFSGDNLLVVIHLTEKGSIKKDIGMFLEVLYMSGLERYRDTYVKADKQQKNWYLENKNFCYGDTNTVHNPEVHVQVDATKSQKCNRVATGEMVPIYEFVCEEE